MRVIDAAIGAAWAMEESALVTLLEIASRDHQITPEALGAYKANPLEGAERAGVRDGVAVLDVAGPLFKRANLMTAYCGASSYDVLMRDFAAALDDGNVRAILCNMDSPGGEAAGCAEFAQAIFEARGRKPIVAYAGDLAASAAYWIASACDSIIIGASGGVGSIGVRCTIPDTSARDARSGVFRYDFVSSQSPFKASDPKTDDGKARIQSRVDALAQVFVETVARNRGVSVAKVLDGFGKGDVLIGGAAIASGMADAFGTFESVLAKLSASPLSFGPARAGAGPKGAPIAAVTGEQAAADMMLSTLGLLSTDTRTALATHPSPPAEPIDRAAAAILDAFRTYAPADHSAASHAASDDEAAVAAILEMLPTNLRKAN